MSIMAVEEKELIAVFTLLILMTMPQNEYGCHASLQISQQSATTQNDVQFNEIQEGKMDQLKIPKDQTLIARLPSNTLLKYNSYKDVSILHFRLPPDTRRAIFTFKAIEDSKSAFQRKCKPRDVSLHLKASSYPVISPENITFPRNFLSSDERSKIYTLQFKSDEEQQRITVNSPVVGNWFAVAFISWTDPNNDRIEQQGLAVSCDTLLLAEVSVSRFHPIIITSGQSYNSTLTSSRKEQNSTISRNIEENKMQTTESAQQHNNRQQQKLAAANNKENVKNSNLTASDSNNRIERTTTRINLEVPKTTQSPPSDMTSQPPQPVSSLPFTSQLNSKQSLSGTSNFSATTNNATIYKFFVPRHIGVATARITFGRICFECPDVGFYMRANAFPSIDGEQLHIHSTIIKPNQTGEISIEFFVQPMNWHYALLKFVDHKSSMNNSFEEHVRPTADRSEEIRAENSKYLQQQKRHTMQSTIDAHESSEIDHLTFTIQIDYQAPSDDSRAEEFKPENEADETKTERLQNSTNSNVNNVKTEAPKPWDPIKFRGMDFYPLLRQTYREFFMYDYDLVPDENGTVPTVLNLTAGMPAGFSFEVGEVYDIGGTLSFAVAMKHANEAASSEATKSIPSLPTAGERAGILAEKLIGNAASNDLDDENKNLEDKNLPRCNQTIIVCMHLGEPGEPTWPDKCRYGRHFLPASSIVNNTDSNTSTGLIHVPFPESGQWYVTMGLYCHGAETASRATIIDSVKEFVRKYAYMLEYMLEPCACASKFPLYQDCINDPDCLSSMNETETLKIKECLMDSKCTQNHLEMTHKFQVHHKSATEQQFALDNCSTSVVFTVSSSPCVAGRCGRYGRCYHYMSGGFVFSTCVCMKGYRGWDCTEDSQVPSSISLLTASLLLILSNLLFFPSIYMAARRKFYTEAVIYFFAMFFSIFYHACDSGEDEYSFCLVKIGVLQFCDFYCGLLAIWVTLIAMSHIRQQFVSLLHMLGAIILAFGTELNKQSLWVFLAPALTGICIISASWGMRCYKSRKPFPSRKYLTVYMPLGAVLVMVGLVCYAFLQTKQNYHIVHSIWHMVMALSILCLLPSHRSFLPKC